MGDEDDSILCATRSSLDSVATRGSGVQCLTSPRGVGARPYLFQCTWTLEVTGPQLHSMVPKSHAGLWDRNRMSWKSSHGQRHGPREVMGMLELEQAVYRALEQA